MLGNCGLGRFTGLLISSVAVQVAAHADCPVLVARGDRRADGPVVRGQAARVLLEESAAALHRGRKALTEHLPLRLFR